MGWREHRRFCELWVVFLTILTAVSASTYISDGIFGHQIATGRNLLQQKSGCPVAFEFQNYTIITSQCKGPQYPPDLCCNAFKEFACPLADQLNDLSNDCATTMFSYININGQYPPGLFASECRDDKNGLVCPALAPSTVQEIFKLNSSEGKKGRGLRLWRVLAVVGGVSGAGAIILILSLLITRRRAKGAQDFERKGASMSKSLWAPSSRSTKTCASSLPSYLCRRFLLDEIKSATANFDSSLVIGVGGFGNVYRGYVDNNLTTVAVKRLNPSSQQGAGEFMTEIQLLSNLRHVHLLSLIGYCDEKGEMILVYDYMANGTLRDHLHLCRPGNSPIPWKQRLQICLGAAKGLHYLHTGAKHTIIHRDVKSSNILLDEKWVAKVSDFGLSKLGPAGGTQDHVSTEVKGSFGYVDPEYYQRRQLTEKSDVYSFGVVLFEALCARSAVTTSLTGERVNLAQWARGCCRKGTLDRIIDPNLTGQIAPECLTTYSEIAINCLKEQGMERPAMSDIVWSLEFASHLQEAAENDGDRRATFVPLILHGSREGEEEPVLQSQSGNGAAAASASMTKPHSGFSDIMYPSGR